MYSTIRTTVLLQKKCLSVALATLNNSPTHPFPQLEKESAIIPELLRRKTVHKKVNKFSPALTPLYNIIPFMLIHGLSKLCCFSQYY